MSNSTKKIYLFVVIFCLYLTDKTLAQHSQIYLRNYNTEHGLPSSEIYCSYKDQKGYMWFGTDNGVARFNGYNFVHFGPLQGLSDPVVFHIQESSDGKIYFFTMSSKVFFYENDRIIPFAFNETITTIVGHSIPLSFHIDKKNNIYIGSNSAGIIKISLSGKVQHLNSAEFLIAFVDDKLVLGHTKKASKKNLFYENDIATDSINIKIVANNSRGVRYFTDTIFLYNGNTLYCLKKDKILWNRQLKSQINHFFIDDNKEIYIAYNIENGLKKYKNVSALHEDKGHTILGNLPITRCMKDNTGSLWISTLDNGIYFSSNKGIEIYDRRSNFSTDYVTSISPISKDETFVLLRNGDILRLNVAANTLVKLPSIRQKLSFNSLAWDAQHQQLIKINTGTGVTFFKHQRWENLFEKNVGGYQTFHFSYSPYLYFSNHNGFFKLDLEKRKVLLYPDSLNFMARTLAVLETREGRVFVGNTLGLFELKKHELVPVPLTHEAARKRIESLAALKDGTIVIGTKGSGILLWKDNAISEYTSACGLSADMIENIHIDDDENIWIGTLNGLNWMSKQKDGSWKIGIKTVENGLPSNEIKSIASYNHTIWVATPKGLAKLDNRQLLPEVNRIRPFIEEVFVNNQNIDFNKKQLFKPNENNIAISYIILTYAKNGNITYRYRLNGQDWTNTMDRKVMLSLNSGNYIFEVQAQFDDGTWSESATYNFTINTPFWKNTYAQVILLLLSAFATYLLYKRRLQKVKQEGALQKELLLLQNKALKAQMNPHFLFNCLNSVQSLIVRGDSSQATIFLSLFGKLVRNVLNASNQDKITLEEDILLIENYLQLEKLRFGKKMNYIINISPTIDQYDIMIPPLLIQPFIENAVIHGINHSSISIGQIIIDYEQVNNFLQISIQDNGIGYKKSQERKTDSAHQSLGMQITEERLKLTKIKKQVHQFKIDELIDDQGNVNGTIVQIRIPVY